MTIDRRRTGRRRVPSGLFGDVTNSMKFADALAQSEVNPSHSYSLPSNKVVCNLYACKQQPASLLKLQSQEKILFIVICVRASWVLIGSCRPDSRERWRRRGKGRRMKNRCRGRVSGRGRWRAEWTRIRRRWTCRRWRRFPRLRGEGASEFPAGGRWSCCRWWSSSSGAIRRRRQRWAQRGAASMAPKTVDLRWEQEQLINYPNVSKKIPLDNRLWKLQKGRSREDVSW